MFFKKYTNFYFKNSKYVLYYFVFCLEWNKKLESDENVNTNYISKSHVSCKTNFVHKTNNIF